MRISSTKRVLRRTWTATVSRGVCNFPVSATYDRATRDARSGSAASASKPWSDIASKTLHRAFAIYAAAAFALFNKASAIRMLAMSISLPSSDTAPFPSFAA